MAEICVPLTPLRADSHAANRSSTSHLRSSTVQGQLKRKLGIDLDLNDARLDPSPTKGESIMDLQRRSKKIRVVLGPSTWGALVQDRKDTKSQVARTEAQFGQLQAQLDQLQAQQDQLREQSRYTNARQLRLFEANALLACTERVMQRKNAMGKRKSAGSATNQHVPENPAGSSNSVLGHESTRIIRAAESVTPKDLVLVGLSRKHIVKFQKASEYFRRRNAAAHETLENFAAFLLSPDYLNSDKYYEWRDVLEWLSNKTLEEMAKDE